MITFAKRAGKSKSVIAAAAAAALVFLGGGLANASEVGVAVVDTIVPNATVALVPGGVSGAITINLSVTGNQEGTATFTVNRDWVLSDNNFTGSNPATFTVAPRGSSNPATTFSTSGTVLVAAGQGSGTFTLAAHAFNVTNTNQNGAKLKAGTASSYSVIVDASPIVRSSVAENIQPSVAVSGFTNGASYELGSDTLPNAMCVVTDDSDTVEPFAAAMSGTLERGLGSQIATCNYTDKGGLSAVTATATYTIVDTVKPTISHSLATPNSNNWYKADVTVAFTCADTGSGVQSCSDSTTLREGANQLVTGTATDWANNSATSTASGINIDTTAPIVSLVGGPNATGVYYFGNVPAAPTCDASDALSGLLADGPSCSVVGGGTSVGTHSYTATATDNAGNVATAKLSYEVKAWTIKGFYSPVVMGTAVVNTVKSGSTVPLKFQLFAGPTELTNTSAIKDFRVSSGKCEVSDLIQSTLTTTGSTSLRYDGGQFIQNWATPKLAAGSCYIVTMTAQDGSTTSADFRLK